MVTLLAGCGDGRAPTAHAAGAAGATSTTAHHVQGRVGTLLIEDGYVPEAASPDVAAAYLTIVNTGGTPARLTAVTSDAAGTVMPMTENTSGGVGSMAPLPDVVVPAHGSFRFRPGAAHLMLEQPHPAPRAGGTVTLILTFAPAGAVTVSLPVTPIGATGSMPSMGMPNG
ncbi:MAG TPA: copper chaperone PCu(A)C [Blastococcus sp.]|nr:copper chaperone PCu(A)C [Blastococcus sp.]